MGGERQEAHPQVRGRRCAVEAPVSTGEIRDSSRSADGGHTSLAVPLAQGCARGMDSDTNTREQGRAGVLWWHRFDGSHASLAR